MQQANKVSISAVIITFNEAKNIARCLNSLAGIADDIVVVDSFSTDDTPQICRSFANVRFIQHAFEGHIEQKNYANTQALYPHILSLDADEALSEPLRQSILEAKNNWQYDGYYMNRLNNYCGAWIRHGTWYPDRKLRLWNSQKGNWGGTNPHDRFIMDKTAKTGRLTGNLLHYTVHSIQQHIGQINKFSSIRAAGMFTKGIKPNFYRLYCKPVIGFVWSYFFRLGFLDGYFGFVISLNSAYSVFLRYAKLKELWKNNNPA
ncbi:glycosyltransferase family 2 protein [Sphingobacteriales bacterium UPWRP_1]|nr:glycosyl transferase [Sphingobacteriales bacterium TSM_CSM]PSJ73452.1 glycosyltransferase family 2 protein [Sphingobacteriales bacterium UPWRP_1]